MNLFDDSAFPVLTDLAAIHNSQLDRLGAWRQGIPVGERIHRQTVASDRVRSPGLEHR